MAESVAGWEQDGNNPDVWRSTIKGGSVGTNPSTNYVYEYNTRSGSSAMYTYGITGNQLLWNVNGSQYKILPNKDLPKGYIQDLQSAGLNLAKLQQYDKSFGDAAPDKSGFTKSNKDKLKALGRYSPDTKGVAPTKPGGGNPDAAGGEAGKGGGNTPPGSISVFRNVENFNTNDTGYNKMLRYPLTIENGQDYVLIDVYNYVVADIFGQGNTSDVNVNSILDGGDISKRTLKESLGYIRLPMPANISEANQTGWGESSLNNLAAGLLGGATGAVEYLSKGNLLDAGTTTIDTAKKVISSGSAGTQIKQQLTLNAAASLVKKLGIQVDAEAYRARATGTVINPNLELLFNGPKLRAFQFSYKMSPRNAEEAKQIRGIIKFFKKAMAPKRAVAQDDAFFLGAPNIFTIKFMHKGETSKSLPTLKTCALVNFTVNYTADGFYSAFYDGQPISVQMDMSFAELTPIYNDNYVFDDTVGFRKDLDDFENNRKLTQEPEPEPTQPPNPPGPSRGGTSGAVAPATGVFQQGGPTATPGVDTPGQFSGRPGSEPIFTGGVRGI